MGRIWVLSVTLAVMVSLTLWSPASGSPSSRIRRPRAPRQNYYNYRPDYDDDQFDSDPTAFNSDFGLRTNRLASRPRPAPTPPTQYADEDSDPSDSWTDDLEPERPLLEPLPTLRSRISGWAERGPISTHHHQSTDGSYSFGYDLQDQSRHETSDSFGNVYGWYSYIDDDGFLHRVSYSAGAGKGFVVHNSGPKSRVRVPIKSPPPPPLIIPESPKFAQGWEAEESDSDYRVPARPWSPPRRRKPSYVVKVRRPVKKEPSWVNFRPPHNNRLASGWTAPKRPVKVSSWEDQSSDGWTESADSYHRKDGSYSFGYDAGTSSRQEYADPWGNVRGSYSYIDPTGFRRTVHYTAGAETGFKILSAQPSSVSNVYRDPPTQVVHHQRQPSAFVYHLHPDGGWKPWEGSDDVAKPTVVRRRKRPQNGQNAISHSYHYQSQGPIRKQQPAKDTPNKRPRPASKADLEEIFDQQYSEADNTEQLTQDESRYEALHDPGENKVNEPKIRGYQGGYGDKNPLLVMSTSSSNRGSAEQEEKKQPLSIAKMMSMRMAQNQRKGKSGGVSKGSSKPDHIPMTMSNSGRLMHYPRSHNQNDQHESRNAGSNSRLRNEQRIISEAEGN